VTPEASTANIRSLCDAVGAFDHTLYVTHFIGLIPISIWLQKNLTAREQAINHFKDNKNELLEIII
jgi:hypothetical protein